MIRTTVKVASTAVEDRRAFSPSAVDSIAAQLERPLPVTYQYRQGTTIGTTVPGTARSEGGAVFVDVNVSFPWWTASEAAAILPRLGAGLGGRIERQSSLGSIRVIEKIQVVEISLFLGGPDA